MEFVIDFIKAFYALYDKFFPYETRQGEDILDACGRYYRAILEGIYPELSQYTMDNIVDDIHDYVEEGRDTKEIASLLRMTYYLEDREDQLNDILDEWSNCVDKELWITERADKMIDRRKKWAEEKIKER